MELKCISNWLCNNKLKINISKTKMMWMNNNKEVVEVRMDDKVIEVVDNIKYLGIHIDYKLNFKLHLEDTIKKWLERLVFCVD